MTPPRGTGYAEDNFHSDVLDGLSHPNHEQSALLGSGQIHSPLPEEEEDEAHAREVSSWKKLPWWTRPSPYWLIFGVFLGSTGISALLSPKVALYTALACRVHKPEYITHSHHLPSFTFPPTHDLVAINAADIPISYVSDGSKTAADTVSIHLPNSAYTRLDYIQDEPDSQQKCASDPVVQAVVAKLNAVFNATTGILSCLTTSWWGSLSDRHGRRIVLLISIFGLLTNDVIHVITAWFVDVLPGGYWFPLVGQSIEGLCGSLSAGAAAGSAYLADTTDPSMRSRYFSLSLGLSFAGIAVGPILGGILMRFTGNILSVFYFASILHGAKTILILFVLPESLTRARARGARMRRKEEKANQASSGGALGVHKSITKLFDSLVVLLPDRPLDANPLKQGRRDWNLFFIAIACGFVTTILGSIPYKFQYAAAQFNWTPEHTSYYLSFIGVTRAFFMAAILPLVIKYLKPTPVQVPSTPDEPLQGDVGLSPSHGASSLPNSAQTNASEHRVQASRSPAFDLALARASEVLESTAFLCMSLAKTGTLFVLASTIGLFASGFSPAAHALSLDIYTNRRSQNRGEVGKLFGALNVIQAFAGQIVSPVLYGFVYSNTVATFPQAIIVMSMCTTLLAVTSLSFVRIPSKLAGECVTPGHENEEGIQGIETPEILVAIEDDVVEGR
ncbi:major facilitator superfamily domain-containing protein [Lanmaoa asiatica]|nr:major facilitator superfamily domain-containing protein [Lanmaoa asiatica]